MSHPEHAEHCGTAEDERTEPFSFDAGWVLQNARESVKWDSCGDHIGPVLQVHRTVRVGEVQRGIVGDTHRQDDCDAHGKQERTLLETQRFREFEVVHDPRHEDLSHIEHQDPFVCDQRPTRRVYSGTAEQRNQEFAGQEGIDDKQQTAVRDHPRSYCCYGEENPEHNECHPHTHPRHATYQGKQ